MSAASVLQSFSPSAMPGPVMPVVDVAMSIYIGHSPPPFRGFLSSYEDLHRARNRVNQNLHLQGQKNQRKQLYNKPLRPCLSVQQKAAADAHDGGGCVGWNAKAAGVHNKKRVVFADSKGMSLTAIHVFSKFDDEPCSRNNRGCRGISDQELQFDLSDLENNTVDLKVGPFRSLALDFKQPSADYLDFRSRMIQNGVCLENCSLQERSLTGTVKVRNVGFEKSVRVRATFDSWASHADVDCTFMNNVYGCRDSDTFTFLLALPARVPPQNRVEFCICFDAPGGQTHWDNNDGKNYTLKHVGWNGEDLNALRTAAAPPLPPASAAADRKKPSEGKRTDGDNKLPEFDNFGSPRMASGLFPGWQSWGQIGSSGAPYW